MLALAVSFTANAQSIKDIKTIAGAAKDIAGGNGGGCWKGSYGRGVGKPLSTCPPNTDKNGLLCYPKCKNDMVGNGPVCWGRCPAGFPNHGAFCGKPKSYGRGAGKIKKCDNCEKNGLLWYPKCREGFHNVACCVCSPNCINGMKDIGVSCAKTSYGRGAGKPMTCRPDQQFDAALCYPHCKANHRGIGPVCWGQCPKGFKDCGALCLSPDNKEGCTAKILGMVGDATKAAVKAVTLNPMAAVDMAKLGGKLAYKVCKH